MPEIKNKIEKLREILKELKSEVNTFPELRKEIVETFFQQIEDFANYDYIREARAGKPEAIYAPGKNPDEIVKILKESLRFSEGVLVTKASEEQIKSIVKSFPDSDVNEKSGTVIVGKKREKIGKVAILTAGTSDISVAEEAATAAEFLGLEVKKYYDVGVAGIHRLINPLKDILSDDVDSIIVVAGMEGALPSVVAGMVDLPVIAVPTSVGYGVNLQGLATLLSMLQSCSSGVAVVNIDNGFGAAVFASLISRMRRR
ncbi:nickel pincer cofactor biosynthesis protein LarB [Archaeoglobales archaeon]|nr:MAG: nickel pincer cofactor biosynthesis protein LarB [Archaeoglobales archaeon]